MKLRVAHFLERYPISSQGFIYDQALRSESRQDVIVALKRLPGFTIPDPVPVTALGRYLRPWAEGLDLLNRATDRVRDDFLFHAHTLLLSRRLESLHEESPFHILHAHYGSAGTRLVEARQRLRIPLVTTFYGYDISAALRDERMGREYRRLAAVGDLFVVLTEGVVERLLTLGVRREKILVWDLGVDVSRYPPATRRPHDGPIRILCAARFVEKKGHWVLLDAVERMSKTRPLRLTLLGYGPVMLPQIREAIRRRGLEDVVRIIDTAGHPDFDRLYYEELVNHDIFALPSLTAANGDDEGGPALTLVCAQASGLPVVTTPHPGAERTVADGETGLLCEPGSANALRARLEALTDDGDLRARLGTQASLLVHERFSHRRQLDALDGHYRRLIECSTQKS